ncbi:MAG: hypothetical protein A2552_08870 [Sulfuricurvum sp. RIFOXYD2_FULL_44_160]|uniref:Uncharacterized protein n=1 Tax=Sulfuricurvum kujiense TaxID=148813 RepID=A0A2D3WPB4_9BACT|nr:MULTISPECIES: hypothetical protein [Sulfuricurvum]OHD91902.1 MAG: hypothetical protein A2552_08870 [Sulfuricurvum sp. RIFOXYD2_FULL_44_160]OHD92433.1 MAG: hypothetical protein A2517_08530 [Sulfuricurvum sp. RIFOXYD12_FULL_44_77]DAB38523.1 MAG TPA: hypothetical protein CFH83_05495 [Sulfuricurvum kujiense]
MNKIFLLILCLVPLWSLDLNTTCEQQNILAKYAGHYADQVLWHNIPIQRKWSSTQEQSYNGISRVNIDKHGVVTAATGWHEGSIQPKCSSIIKNKLWIINEFTNHWEGPFIRVSKDFDENTIYFNRLFQNKCYKDELNQKWCFRNGEIQIDKKKIKVELMLDTDESPLYGNALRLEEDRSRLWMFVPHKNGWKIFQDTFVTDEKFKEIDPLTDKPWHFLKLDSRSSRE